MITATVLLRAVIRICGANAAIVADADGAILFTAGASVAPTHKPICECAIASERRERAARLLVFADGARHLEAATLAAVEALAVEIGTQLDMQAAFECERRDPVDDFVGPIASGIDSIGDAAAILAWPATPDTPRIAHVNAAFEALFGRAAATTVGATTALLFGELTDRDRLAFLFERVRANGAARGPVVLYGDDGLPIWVELSLRAVVGAAGESSGVVATLRDVTARKEFELAVAKEKRKLQVTLAAIGDAVITTVADGRVDFVNLAARTIFGVDAAEAYGQPIGFALRLTDAQGAVIDVLRGGDESGGIRRGQALFGRGSVQKHVAFVTSPIADEGYVVVLRDVTAQHRLATQLSYEAAHDALTGMYNRRKFDELLLDAIEAAQSSGRPHTLAFLDLDRFKHVNDSCGHAVGDRVLLDLAHLLQSQLRGRDVLARIGGDEFAILLHDCALADARRVLDALRRSVESYRLAYRGVEYHVGVSIGITPIDGGETDAAAILQRADAACYAAKQRGRNAIAG